MEEALILVSDILKQFCVLIYMYTCEHTSIHSKHLLYYMYSFQRFSKLCVYVGGGGGDIWLREHWEEKMEVR